MHLILILENDSDNNTIILRSLLFLATDPQETASVQSGYECQNQKEYSKIVNIVHIFEIFCK